MTENIKFVDINISNCIKGIAAIFIMLGHYVMDYPWYITMFFSGHLWVAVFFFFSGYGLKYSYQNKHNYLNNFILKKAKQIYLPFFIAESVYAVSLALISKSISISNIYNLLLSCLGLRLSNGSLWYVVEILVIYFVFYLSKKLLKNRLLSEGIWIPLYLAFLLFAVLNDIDTCWYISTLTFLIGYYYDLLYKFLYRFTKDTVLKALTVLLFTVIYSLTKYYSYTHSSIGSIPYTYVVTFLNLISAPLFISFCIVICSFIKDSFKIGILLKILGNISYEIYLWHMCVFMLVNLIEINSIFRIIISFLLTLVLSCILKLKNIKSIYKSSKKTVRL